MTFPVGYPEHRAVDVPLRDGSTIHVRPVLPSDLFDVGELFGRISAETSRLRFHGVRRPSVEELRRFVEVDYRNVFSLVALTARGNEPRIVAFVSYVVSVPGTAELAIVVDDPFQGRGVGSVLMEHLGEAAAEAGIGCFEADVLSTNNDMLEVITALRLPVRKSLDAGVVRAQFPTSPTAEAIEAFEKRDAVAAAAALRSFFVPRSVAVIGASRKRGTISGELFHNLIEAGFAGPVYPVNPSTDVVQSVAAFKSVLDVPGPVDLAVVVVPADRVLQVAEECAQKDVRALLVISSGFAETGEEGARRQQDLLTVARRYGMRIVGPNCMGLLNADPAVRLNATFAPLMPASGRLAFSSQSGALGIAVMERAAELGLGLSTFISVGNKADISGNDLLQYWEQDPNTDVVLLYLESFGNPRKFARIARRVAQSKPVVAVKSGRSQAGARAAASHTASLVAQDVAVDALFHQAGVIRTETLEELFDVANLLAHQPLPSGPNVAILTNAGGLGILCADACEAAGLVVPELSTETVAALERLLPAEASAGNPVDMIASASAEHYAEALRILLVDPTIDSVIVIFIPPLVTRAEDVAAGLMKVAVENRSKTLLGCFLGVHGIHESLREDGTAIPTHAFPESAAKALGSITRYSQWLERDHGEHPSFDDIDHAAGVRLAATLIERGDRWLEPHEVTALLEHYGIPAATGLVVKSPEEVAKAAAQVGTPVVVKIVSSTILHKSDVGGVRVGLTSPEEAAEAAREMLAALKDAGRNREVDGFLVQELVSSEGAEFFIGVTHDPLFGPLIACGAGGTMVELMRDVSVRITPLTNVDASEMLDSLKSRLLFEGYRGQPPLDAAALKELLLRVSVLVEDLPHVAELDLNPVVVRPSPRGSIVLDARVRVAAPKPPSPLGARIVPGRRSPVA
ncbi:MAG TPA: GNAT family N-acetyltransferase [Actinomycetota bacterium]|nr:GNAT family N-acetyltransferase [Actinomycetota bacterium]